MPVNPIEAQSYAILAERVDLSGWPPGPRDVVARMIHATADESFASSALIGSGVCDAAVRALQNSAAVVCDANMVVAGIPSVRSAVCYLDQVPAGAVPTRSAAAFDIAARRHPTGAVWVVGNAPTALFRLMDLHAAGDVEPAAVIGVPVGYVGAADAKRALWESDLRDIVITNEGARGGSPVAAAAVNALVRLAGV